MNCNNIRVVKMYPLMPSAGCRHFRVELLDEDAAATRHLVGVYHGRTPRHISGVKISFWFFSIEKSVYFSRRWFLSSQQNWWWVWCSSVLFFESSTSSCPLWFNILFSWISSRFHVSFQDMFEIPYIFFSNSRYLVTGQLPHGALRA